MTSTVHILSPETDNCALLESAEGREWHKHKLAPLRTIQLTSLNLYPTVRIYLTFKG